MFLYRTLLLVFATGFYSCQFQTNDNQKIQKILQSHTEAMGGLEAWKKMQAYEMHQVRPNGMSVSSYAVKPDRFKLHFRKENLSVVKSYDGKNGWISRNEAYLPMRPGEVIEMKEEPDFYDELMMAYENEHELIYRGMEPVNGTSCHQIAMVKSEVDTHFYWINENTHLIEMIGEYSEDKAHEGIFYKTTFSDYREVDGYLFPFKMALIPNDRQPIEMTYTDIKVNQSYAPTFFSYQPQNTRNLIEMIQDQESEGHLKSFTFDQETIRFDEAGQPRDTSIWKEAVEYPDLFRIDIGERTKKNSNFFRSDSVYVFRKGELVHTGIFIQAFLIMEGGLFYYSADSVMKKLAQLEIDTSTFDQSTYQDIPVYIIGAKKGNLSVPQIWMHQDRLCVVRRFSNTRSGGLLEVRYDKFIQKGDYWIETCLEFYENNRLVQTERYYNIDIDLQLPKSVFDPNHFGNSYW